MLIFDKTILSYLQSRCYLQFIKNSPKGFYVVSVNAYIIK